MKFKIIAGLILASIVALFFAIRSDADFAPHSQFVMLDGTVKELDQFRGKVLLVNFWATSCTTCIAEMPDLVRVYEKNKSRGFHTIGVAMQYDPPSYVVNFAQSRKLPFDIAIDNTGKIARDWGDVKLTPTTYIVSKSGKIAKRYVGKPDFAELETLIERLLKES